MGSQSDRLTGGENSCQDGLWGAWSVWFGDPAGAVENGVRLW